MIGDIVKAIALGAAPGGRLSSFLGSRAFLSAGTARRICYGAGTPSWVRLETTFTPVIPTATSARPGTGAWPSPARRPTRLCAVRQPEVDLGAGTVATTRGARIHGDVSSGLVEMRGLEPLTPAMRTRCSPS